MMLNNIKEIIYKKYLNIISFSQEGEDKILERMFNHKKEGFFVDVGAHHPIRFSNTYKFYLKGWNGINIDAMPGSMRLFNKIRPRDINIEAAIFDAEKKLTYYAFNEPALNGFSKDISAQRDGKGNYKIIFQKEINTQKLSTILDENCTPAREIDFLSVDVEGLDLNVLKSNNWNKYRPTILLVENLSDSFYDSGNEMVTFLKDIEYSLVAKTYNTDVFRNNY